MYGIATINSSNLSNYKNRLLLVEVVNADLQGHNSHYTLKVNYNRLGHTLQRIQRNGGKILRVSCASELHLQTVGNPPTHPTDLSAVAEACAVVSQTGEETTTEPNPQEKIKQSPKAFGKAVKSNKREKKSKHRR